MRLNKSPTDCFQNEEVAELNIALADAPWKGTGAERDAGGASQPLRLVLNIVDNYGNSLSNNVRPLNPWCTSVSWELLCAWSFNPYLLSLGNKP